MNLIQRSLLCLVLPALSCLLNGSPAPVIQAEAGNPSLTVKRLVLDDRVVDRVENVRLRVGAVAKHPANPLFREDRPWEVRFDNVYPNVVYDAAAKLYRCWYSPFIVDELTTGTSAEKRRETRYRSTPTREMGLCHATSTDGIRWEKPALGLVEFNGSTANNLVLRYSHGAGVLHDLQEKDPARRYKIFGGQQVPGLKRQFQVAFSPDGLHWAEPLVSPEIGVDGDTHNNAIWVPELGKYVGITRRWLAGERLVMRSESADFTRWTPAVEVMRGQGEDQTYAMPIFAYGNLYLGLVMVINTRTDRVQCELAWSPDTVLWRRIDPGQALIPNSSKPEDYDWGCVYAGTGLVVRDGNIQLYYGASDGPHTGWRAGFLALATLPVDRFAGYVAEGNNGTVLTQPLEVTGSRLEVNVAAAEGEFSVEVLGADGRPIAGLSGEDAARFPRVDAVGFPVSWKNADAWLALRGKSVRLKFHLKRAKLYAFELQ